jgi:archaeosine synthase
MADEFLGVSTAARWRYSRLIGLGDRKQPLAYSPCLIQSKGDPELPVALSPFTATQNSEIPATLTITAKGKLSPPFEVDGPTWSVDLGHVLPPSLDEADVGEVGGQGSVLPISWQRMKHDTGLLSLETQPQIIVLLDALQLANRPGRLPEALISIRNLFPGALIWAPGIGGPDNLAVLAWMGVDLFDLGRTRQSLSIGAMLTSEGPRMPEESLGEVASWESAIAAWTNEFSSVRRAIRDGNLRELVEKRAPNSPRLVEHLRYHDKLLKHPVKSILSSVVPAETRLRCHTFSSREDPIVSDWYNLISQTYEAPKNMREVLILLPCSAKKPYRFSKSHKAFMRSIGNTSAHHVMVTSPLGLVPRDLERIWPAAHYDVPVTGDWDADEILRIRTLAKGYVAKQGYKVVINHSGVELPDLGIPCHDTRQGDGGTSYVALDRLSAKVKEVMSELGLKGIRGHKLLMAEFASISRHHGLNDHWLDGAVVSGKPPRFKIMLENKQLAQWNPIRASLSVSKAALPIMYEKGSLPVVEISMEGSWNGDIFGAMVVSYPENIRVGAEFLVVKDGDLIGSARAVAPGFEWPSTPGRLAKAQHRLKKR